MTRKQKCGYQWMRLGKASPGFTAALMLLCLAGMLYFAMRVYLALPETAHRPACFAGLYLLGALLYANLGVWLHEQLHCLALRAAIPQNRWRIVYERKYLLFLGGYYRVRGPMGYRVMRRALLGPLLLPLGLLLLGWLGGYILPAWWFPLLASLALAGVLDMTHDLYWVVQTLPIAEQGKYWDTGRALHVVWKE